MKGWCSLRGEITGGDWSRAQLGAHGGVQGLGRTSLEALGKAQQDKERQGERLGSL